MKDEIVAGVMILLGVGLFTLLFINTAFAQMCLGGL